MSKKKQESKGGGSISSNSDMGGQKLDFNSIRRDIEFLGSAHMTWKQKKDLENKKVVSLGGKPPKKQRLPLSVARVMMKKQKEREKKMTEENSILGQFGSNHGRDTKRAVERRRPENKVLKSTAGHFRNGVLVVNHLLQPSTPKIPKITEESRHAANRGKKMKGGKKNRGKKKGGGRRHH